MSLRAPANRLHLHTALYLVVQFLATALVAYPAVYAGAFRMFLLWIDIRILYINGTGTFLLVGAWNQPLMDLLQGALVAATQLLGILR